MIEDEDLSLDQLVEDGLFADVFGPTALTLENGRGPRIWLAGDPEDLSPWLEMGAAGIVTNTIVLNEMVRKYGQLTDVVMRYLDITDKPVVMEIDGHSTGELIDVGHYFCEMSDQIMLKIPCYPHALEAFRHFSDEGIETFCTTVFSLNQAAAVASAGVDHILPFCEPVKRDGRRPDAAGARVRGDVQAVAAQTTDYGGAGAVGGDDVHGAAGRGGRGGDLLAGVPGHAPAFSD